MRVFHVSNAKPGSLMAKIENIIDWKLEGGVGMNKKEINDLELIKHRKILQCSGTNTPIGKYCSANNAVT